MISRIGRPSLAPLVGVLALCALSGCASGRNLSLNSRTRVVEVQTSDSSRTVFAQALGPESDILVADGNVLLPGSFASPSAPLSPPMDSLALAAGRGAAQAVQPGLGATASLVSGAGLVSGALGVGAAAPAPSPAPPAGRGASVGLVLGAPSQPAATVDLAANVSLVGGGAQPAANVSLAAGAAAGPITATANLTATASPTAVGTNLNLDAAGVATANAAVTVAAGPAPTLGVAAGVTAPALGGAAVSTQVGVAPTTSGVSVDVSAALPGSAAPAKPLVTAQAGAGGVQAAVNPQALIPPSMPGSVKLTDVVAQLLPTLRLGGGR